MNETELIEKHISQADDLDALAKMLWILLNDGFSAWDDGTLLRTKQLVEQVNGLRIEVYPNEHPPPHFHVITGGNNASFTIENCSVLAGNLDRKDIKLVKWWHSRAQQKLIAAWDETRATGCSVGEYCGATTPQARKSKAEK